MPQSDKRSPADYPRRVLLATTGGMSPAVMTETLWALRLAEGEAFIPTEIHCVTTGIGAHKISESLLKGGVFQQYVSDYGPAELATAFDETGIHIVQRASNPLDDIQTEADNEALADLITDLVRDFTSDPNCALHVSIAGGRKTMTFLGGYILSIFARPQDRLSHVLVDPRFEIPAFFYPPPAPQEIDVRGGRVSTEEARIVLADIPIIHLRPFLRQNPIGGPKSYSEIVALAQRLVDPPALQIDISARQLRCQGLEVSFEDKPEAFAFVLYLAERIVAEDSMEAGAITYEEFADQREQDDFRRCQDRIARDPDALDRLEERRLERGEEPVSRSTFSRAPGRINARLEAELVNLADRYVIHTFRGKRRPQAIGFRLDPDQIIIRE